MACPRLGARARRKRDFIWSSPRVKTNCTSDVRMVSLRSFRLRLRIIILFLAMPLQLRHVQALLSMSAARLGRPSRARSTRGGSVRIHSNSRTDENFEAAPYWVTLPWDDLKFELASLEDDGDESIGKSEAVGEGPRGSAGLGRIASFEDLKRTFANNENRFHGKDSSGTSNFVEAAEGFSPAWSPVEKLVVRDTVVYVKRDDLLRLQGPNLSGNKARKLLALLDTLERETLEEGGERGVKAIVSHGGHQVRECEEIHDCIKKNRLAALHL